MTIEKQVVSLKLAKELKANNYEQEGIWWWIRYLDGKEQEHWEVTSKTSGLLISQAPSFVAPTVSELGERLPDSCVSGKTDDGEWCCYQDFMQTKKPHSNPMYASTEVNARAKMWLYLKKEDLL